MILYFTGTGNSRYVAQNIAKDINDEIVSINHLIKQKNKKQLVSKDRPFVFVSPTYAWRLPQVVTEFITTMTYSGSNKVYFIMTCGADTSNSISYIKQLCEDKNWDLKGIAEVIMPDNYIALFPSSDENTAKKIIQRANPLIRQIASDIRNENKFIKIVPSGFKGKIKSGIVNVLFYKLFVNANGFHTTKLCTGCGKCVKLCPLNNIDLNNNIPHWSNKCTHCMACISCCPSKAIEYKNKTQGKTRYYLK